MLGFETDGQRRMLVKSPTGENIYFTPDLVNGAPITGINANDVEYVNPSYPGLGSAGFALDYLLGLTGSQGSTGLQGETGSQGHTGFQGFTGIQGETGTSVLAALDTNEPTGFVNRTDSTISFDDSSRTFYIHPSSPGGTFDYWIRGNKNTIGETGAVTVPDSYDLNYIYYDDGGSLVLLTNPSGADTSTIFRTKAIASIIQWQNEDDEAILFGEERHGITMDGVTHLYNHYVIGAQWLNGLGLSGFTVDGNGDLDASSQFACADGSIVDEDIVAFISDDDPQDLDPIAYIPVYYKDGAQGNFKRWKYTDTWQASTAYSVGDRIVESDSYFEVTVGGTSGGSLPAFSSNREPGDSVSDNTVTWVCIGSPRAPVINNTTGNYRLVYNEFTGGTWQRTEVSNNDFVLAHIVATNDLNNPIIAVLGQEEYNTTNQAREGANTEVNNLITTGLPFVEFTFIGTVIYQSGNGYDNQVKARVRSTDLGDDYVDFRGTPLAGRSAAVSNHSDLAGLTNLDHPASAIINSPTGVITSTNVQDALNELALGYTGLIIDNSTDNAVLTATSDPNVAHAETGLQYDGSNLVNGNGYFDSKDYYYIDGIKIVSVDGTNNVLLGEMAGDGNTGSSNIAVGRRALGGNAGTATGNDNVCIGSDAGRDLTSGISNVFLGSQAGQNVTTGSSNFALGKSALDDATTTSNTIAIGSAASRDATGSSNVVLGGNAARQGGTGSNNVYIGFDTGRFQGSGVDNVMLGHSAGRGNSAYNTSNSIYLGHDAGRYETGTGKLFIDSLNRTDEATARTNSLIYGVFDATPANQILRLNTNVGINVEPSVALHIQSSSDELLRLDHSSATGNPRLSFYQNGVSRSYIQHNDSGDYLTIASEYGGISFRTSLERFRIESDGGIFAYAMPTGTDNSVVVRNSSDELVTDEINSRVWETSINLVDMINGSNNRVCTAVDSETINAESNLTFDGNLLVASGSNDEILRINHSSSTGNPRLSFYQNGVSRSYIQQIDGGNFWINAPYGAISLRTGTGGSLAENFRVESDGGIFAYAMPTGTDNTVVIKSAVDELVTDEINSRVWETSINLVDMTNGSNNRVCTAVDSNTINAESNLTFDGNELAITSSTDDVLRLETSSATGNPRIDFFQNGTRRSYINHVDTGDALNLVSEFGYISFKTDTAGTEIERFRIESDGGVFAYNMGTGTDNSVVVRDSSSELVTREIDSRVWGSSLIDGSGTADYVARFSDTNTIAIGSIRDDASTVGINTAPGSQSLHVYRNINMGAWPFSANLANSVFRIEDSSVSMYFDGNAIISTGSTLRIGTASAHTLSFGTNDTEQLRIGTAGELFALNMGTGTDNSVVVRTGTSELVTDEIDSRVWGSTLVDASSATADYVARFSDTNTIVNSLIRDDGIGVAINTAPSNLALHVYRNINMGSWPFSASFSSAVFRIEDSSISMYFDGNAVITDGSTMRIGTASTHDLSFGTNDIERFKVSSDGGIFAYNMATGTDNSVVVRNSSSELVTDEINSRVWETSLNLVDMTNGSNNRVCTAVDSNTINGESNLTFDGSTLFVDGTTKLGGTDLSAGRLIIQDAGNTIDPRISLLVGADILGETSITNSERKFARIGTPHYTNSEQPASILICDSDGTDNKLILGGGTTAMNAATQLRFYTATNNTTTTGTERLRIESDGGIFAYNMGTGTDNSVVVRNSSNELVTDEIDSRVWGSTLVNMTNGSNNRVCTATDSNSINGESALTFDGSTLEIDSSTDLMLKLDRTSATGNPGVGLYQAGTLRSYIRHLDAADTLALVSDYGQMTFSTGTSGSSSTRLTIDPGGLVGIGTSPSVKLHLQSSGDEHLRLDHSSSTGSPSLYFYQNGTGRGYVQYEDSGDELRLTSLYGSVTLRTGSAGSSTERVEVNTVGTTTIKTASGTSQILALTSGSSTGNPYLSITQNGTERSRMQFLDASDLLEISNGYGPLSLSTGSAGSWSDRLQITSSGRIYMFDLNGSTGSSDARYNTSTGELFYDTSSLRYKENILRLDPDDTSWVYDVEVKKYDRKDGSKTGEIGIIAEELEKINKDFVCYNKHGQAESYSKSDLVPVLLAELQKVRKELDELKGK